MAQIGLHRTGCHAQSIRFRIGPYRIRLCHSRRSRICEPNLVARPGEGHRRSQVGSAKVPRTSRPTAATCHPPDRIRTGEAFQKVVYRPSETEWALAGSRSRLRSSDPRCWSNRNLCGGGQNTPPSPITTTGTPVASMAVGHTACQQDQRNSPARTA